MANIQGWCGWLQTCVDAAGRFRENFTEGDFYAFGIFGVEVV
jgi:hypothetical protein